MSNRKQKIDIGGETSDKPKKSRYESLVNLVWFLKTVKLSLYYRFDQTESSSSNFE